MKGAMGWLGWILLIAGGYAAYWHLNAPVPGPAVGATVTGEASGPPRKAPEVHPAAVSSQEASFPAASEKPRTEPIPQSGPLNREQVAILMETVQDHRYSKEVYIRCLPAAAELKRQLLARGLVDRFNSRYGMSLAPDGRWSVQQINDLVYEVVAQPDFDISTTLASLE